jgi:hypothetical protein
MIDVSSPFSALLPISHKFVSKLEVWTDGVGSGAPGATYLATLDEFSQASVTEDETRQVRRTLTATLHSAPIGDPTSIVPVSPGDLIHPVSGHEIRAFAGLEYPDGSIEWCPKGIFRISKPAPQDVGGQITIPLIGNDRSITITQAGWQDSWSPAPGTTIDQVIKQGIAHVFPTGNYHNHANLAASTVPISGGVVFGAQLDSSNDPWKDFQGLAASIGQELFFDANGIVTSRQVPTPDIYARDWPNNHGNPEFLYLEGAQCLILGGQGGQGLTHTIDETGAFSRVIVIGNNPGSPVVQGTANDTNVNSSTYYLGPFGIVTKIVSSPAVTTVGQAQSMAQGILNQFGLALDEVSFVAITNPALEAGDIIEVLDDRLGVANLYAVSATTMPMDPATAQTVVCRPSRGGNQGFLRPL